MYLLQYSHFQRALVAFPNLYVMLISREISKTCETTMGGGKGDIGCYRMREIRNTNAHVIKMEV